MISRLFTFDFLTAYFRDNEPFEKAFATYCIRCLCYTDYKAQATLQKLNIILIYVDDLGYGDIGVNGAMGVKRPILIFWQRMASISVMPIARLLLVPLLAILYLQAAMLLGVKRPFCKVMRHF